MISAVNAVALKIYGANYVQQFYGCNFITDITEWSEIFLAEKTSNIRNRTGIIDRNILYHLIFLSYHVCWKLLYRLFLTS